MVQIEKKILILVFIIIIIVMLIYPFYENFDSTMTEFVPVGYPRYGLRGDLLKRSNIKKYYINPNRNIRLSHSTGEMWESNKSPPDEHIKNCRKVPCPDNDGYDKLDTCWKCGNECRKSIKIPDIWPH